MENMHTNLTIWIVSQGIAGTENQCLAVAEALGGTVTIKRVDLRGLWRFVSPWWALGEGPGMLTPDSDTMTPPWPDVVIAGGRRAVGIARYIRRASGGHTIVIMMQNPYVAPQTFDLVAAPFHDNIKGPNVIVTDGAPTRNNATVLDVARTRWADTLGTLPGPRLAVLVGGNSRTHTLGPAEMDALIARVQAIQVKDNASLMITVSRRTPAELVARLETALNGPHTVIFTGQGENPYAGFLAFADYFIITNDSTSMISDAASTGKPIDIFRLTGTSKRSERFQAHLDALGIGDFRRGYKPFDDAGRVAQAVRDLLEQREQKGV